MRNKLLIVLTTLMLSCASVGLLIACGHTHEYQKAVTDPTCEAGGFTTYTCECGESYVADETDALGHSYGEWVTTLAPTNVATGLRVKECACGDTIESVIPKAPKFRGANLSLESNIAITYNVNESILTTDGYTDVSGGVISFSFKKIGPTLMMDEAVATLYAKYDGVEYAGQTAPYSVVTYVKSKINTTDAVFKTLLVDLLNYGAATQLYVGYKTDALANNWLTAEQLECATPSDRKPESCLNASAEKIDAPTASWKGANLLLEDAVVIRFITEVSDLNGVQAAITVDGNTTYIPASEFSKNGGGTNRYNIDFAGLDAAQMSAKVSIKLLKDGVVISDTATYSVESYVAQKYNDNNVQLVSLVKALLKYGDSVARFANR